MLARLQPYSYIRLARLPACAWTAYVLAFCHVELVHAMLSISPGYKFEACNTLVDKSQGGMLANYQMVAHVILLTSSLDFFNNSCFSAYTRKAVTGLYLHPKDMSRNVLHPDPHTHQAMYNEKRGQQRRSCPCASLSTAARQLPLCNMSYTTLSSQPQSCPHLVNQKPSAFRCQNPLFATHLTQQYHLVGKRRSTHNWARSPSALPVTAKLPAQTTAPSIKLRQSHAPLTKCPARPALPLLQL